MMDIDVLVIGRSCLDIISVVEQFPREDTKVPLLYRMVEGGGQGGTASCCIARLGGKVMYYGCLGADSEGLFCLERLKEFNVEMEYVDVVEDGKTPVAYLFVTRGSGKRTIIYEKNTLPPLRVDRLVQILVNPVKVVLLGPETTYLAEDVRALAGDDIRIVYDCERWHEDITTMMAAADYFIPSADFLQMEELNLADLSFEQQMFRLAGMVSGALVVTQGEKGAYYISEEQLINVPAPAVEVKDTTGAGDNFHAAFCLAISRGDDLPAAVKFSVAVASLSCREYGGRQGIPEITEAQELAAKLKEQIIATK
ncbi:MAG: PfkB family carbohydrate kinase [Smithella sp.]